MEGETLTTIKLKVWMNHDFILEHAFSIENIVDYLVSKLYFCADDRDFIERGRESRTRRDQLIRLFECLFKKDEGVWKAFFDALVHSGNDVIVEQLKKTNCDGVCVEDLERNIRSSFQPQSTHVHHHEHHHHYGEDRNTRLVSEILDPSASGLSGVDDMYTRTLEKNLQSVLPDFQNDEELKSAVRVIEKEGSLIITGADIDERSKSLLKYFSKDYKPIILHECAEWDKLKGRLKKNIVLLEDIFGVEMMSKIKATAWSEILPTLPEFLLKSQCPLIISLSAFVFDEVKKSRFWTDCKLCDLPLLEMKQKRKRRTTGRRSQSSQHVSGDKTLPRSLSQAPVLPSELHEACFSGDVSEVKELIEKDESLKSEVDNVGQTPLHVACSQQQVEIVCILLGIEEADLVEYIIGESLDVGVMLLKAAALGHTKMVEELLVQRADLAARDEDERSALHLACLNNHLQVVEALLKHKADLTLADKDGCTPLHLACSSGHDKMVALLLQGGANAELLDKNGFSPAHVACKENRIEIVQALLQNGTDVDQATQGSKQTLLHVASSFGHVELVKLLISKTKRAKDMVDVKGCTALHLAAESGRLEVVVVLLEKKFDVNACDRDGLTALHRASVRDHGMVIEKLVGCGANIDETDNRGQSALHLACKSGSRTAVTFLVKYKANCMLFDHKLNTPLHVACQEGQPGALQAMLLPVLYTSTPTESGLNVSVNIEFVQNARLNVNLSNRDGDTPLILACRSGLVLAVWALLGRGPVQIDALNYDHNTAVHEACAHGHVNIVKTLLDLKVRTDIQNNQGLFPVHVAANNGFKEIVSMLLENKANLDMTDARLQTPLHLASKKGHTQIVQILVDGGCDINAADVSGLTALHNAARCGHAGIVKILLGHEADANVLCKKKATPLERACYFDHQAVVDLLLDCKAHILSPDEGQRCLELACHFGYKKIVMSLLKKGAKMITDSKKYPSPLILALGMEHFDVALLLLENDCSLPVILGESPEGQIALHMVCKLGHNYKTLATMMLKQKPDVNAASLKGRTALMYASANGHFSIVQMLLSAHADANKADDDGITPLMLAARSGEKRTVEHLLHSHVKVDAVDKSGQTALFWASASGHGNIVQLLIAKCNSTIDTADCRQRTPLLVASAVGHKDVVQALIRYGAKVNIAGKSGCLPIHCASEGGFADIVELLLKAESPVNELFEQSITALRLSCNFVAVTGQMAVVYVLLKYGAIVDYDSLEAACLLNQHTPLLKTLLNSLNEADKKQAIKTKAVTDGATLLHLASLSGNVEIVELLVALDADVNSADIHGSTPLFYSCFKGHSEVTKYLLNKGADAQIKNNDGYTALDVAAKGGHQDCVNILSH